VTFDYIDESNGTQVFFRTAGAWLNVLANGEVLIFDEINTSLHPLLVRFLIAQSHSNEANARNAQLIFSTHDATLLARYWPERPHLSQVMRSTANLPTMSRNVIAPSRGINV
jgi:AAA15 family ATPase/GTPase